MTRALFQLEINEEPPQRKSLFRPKYSKVVIDSGSSNNLVLEEMVTKLKLEILKHPKPYQIAWIQDEHKVLVSEQCLVKFHIGSYHDEVLCDIMPMDVCHILLGRP